MPFMFLFICFYDSKLPMQGPGFEPWSENCISHAATKNSLATAKDSAGCSEDQTLSAATKARRSEISDTRARAHTHTHMGRCR